MRSACAQTAASAAANALSSGQAGLNSDKAITVIVPNMGVSQKTDPLKSVVALLVSL